MLSSSPVHTWDSRILPSQACISKYVSVPHSQHPERIGARREMCSVWSGKPGSRDPEGRDATLGRGVCSVFQLSERITGGLSSTNPRVLLGFMDFGARALGPSQTKWWGAGTRARVSHRWPGRTTWLNRGERTLVRSQDAAAGTGGTQPLTLVPQHSEGRSGRRAPLTCFPAKPSISILNSD